MLEMHFPQIPVVWRCLFNIYDTSCILWHYPTHDSLIRKKQPKVMVDEPMEEI